MAKELEETFLPTLDYSKFIKKIEEPDDWDKSDTDSIDSNQIEEMRKKSE